MNWDLGIGAKTLKIHIMTGLIELLQSLNRYRFSLQAYKTSHSEVELSAINPNDTSLRFKVGFADVHYIQLPISWIGSFIVGSDNEREEVIHRTGLRPVGAVSSEVKLYKSLQGEVLILGGLMLVQPQS